MHPALSPLDEAASKGPAPDPPADPSSGVVVQTLAAGKYLVVQLRNASGQLLWAAGTKTAGVTVGARVKLANATAMKNFHLKSLARTFELIYFAKLQVEGPGPARPAPSRE